MTVTAPLPHDRRNVRPVVLGASGEPLERGALSMAKRGTPAGKLDQAVVPDVLALGLLQRNR